MGKSTPAQNLGYQAVMHGQTVWFTTAANRLNDLAALDSDNALRRRIKQYAKPAFLIEADCVYQLLDDLKEALWQSYGEDIVRMYKTIHEEQQAGNEESDF